MFLDPFYQIRKILRYKIVNLLFIFILCIFIFIVGFLLGRYTNLNLVGNIPTIPKVSSYELNNYESEFKIMCNKASGLYNDFYGYCDLGKQVIFSKYILLEYLNGL